MDQLPPDFAETLARVVEPGHEAAVAEIIKAATHLDDDGLRMFLERFADRVRSSATPVRRDELLALLQQSQRGASAAGT
jgi:hypothetical protein